MLQKTEQLIGQFYKQPLSVPISKKELELAVDILFEEMFPLRPLTPSSKRKSERALIKVYDILSDSIGKLLDLAVAEQVLDAFFDTLPAVHNWLLGDANAFLANDPAARSLEEVVLTYPGFFAVAVHRIAHELYKLKVPIIPRLFSEYAHAKVGIDIHPGAEIGGNFFLDHGTGTVIGETSRIGSNVKLYQGVTLGALYVNKQEDSARRHPTVEDNVVIYAGATILGGNTVIGHDSVIGGNAWITESVAPYSMVYHTTKMKFKNVRGFSEPINYVI